MKATEKREIEKSGAMEKPGKKKAASAAGVFGGIAKAIAIILETALLLVLAAYCLLFVVVKGPSPTAGNLLVLSLRETSAIGFIAEFFLTEEEILAIEANRYSDEYVATDTSLININTETQPEQGSEGPVADQWGLIDEDGDGIILEPVKGEGYSGFMMVVKDPTRVIMGSKPSSFGRRGYTVEEMVKEFDAVAGINAGGFYDPDGQGNGSIPDSMVVVDGKVYYGGDGCRNGFVGFDSDNIMHVGMLTPADVTANNIQTGVCFGPVLISNGEPSSYDTLASGVNPRTAIGQRSDGAVLLLVIDGRQAISLGATYQDLVDIMLSYGAVNALNLDGGSSTLMYYEGAYVNNCASVIGIRPVPTTFLVLKEGANE